MPVAGQGLLRGGDLSGLDVEELGSLAGGLESVAVTSKEETGRL